jgi:hypothetical protein
MCTVIFYQCQWVLSLEVFLIFSTLLGFSWETWSFSSLSHIISEFQNWMDTVLICLQIFYVPHLLQSQNFVNMSCTWHLPWFRSHLRLQIPSHSSPSPSLSSCQWRKNGNANCLCPAKMSIYSFTIARQENTWKHKL